MPIVLGRHYLCEDCQVYGVGFECWLCGSGNGLSWGALPKFTCAHLHRESETAALEWSGLPPTDWSTPAAPPVDPMTLYAEAHGVVPQG